jgi:hypothetical protein
VDSIPDFSGDGIPTAGMVGKTVMAVVLQRNLNIPMIVSVGRAHKSRSSEALIRNSLSHFVLF